jgi:putative flippase GtrA
MRLGARFGWFLVAGCAGFAVDAAVLTGLVWLGAEPRLARLASFAIAMIATWLINRRRAFGDRAGPPSLREFAQYAAASMLGALVNLAIFMALVTWGEPFRSWPVAALTLATGVSLFINFWSYLKVVFAPRA